MIKDLYPEQFSRLDQLFCDPDILAAWRQVAGRMIVTENNRYRVGQYGTFKHIPWRCGGCCDRADADRLNSYQIVFDREHYRKNHFPVRIDQLLPDQLIGIFFIVDPDDLSICVFPDKAHAAPDSFVVLVKPWVHVSSLKKFKWFM